MADSSQSFTSISSISSISSSPLSEIPISEILFWSMPSDTRDILRGYKEINECDRTKDILWNAYQYLPDDGRMNLDEDIIDAAATDSLYQLAYSIAEGVLKPLKVHGGRTAPVTPSPRRNLADSLEDLASLTDQPMQRQQAELKVAAMARDGGKCVICGETELDAVLETAYIVPFALATWDSNIERDRKISVWDNMLRCFPSLKEELNFYYQQINNLQNIMMLQMNLHYEFRRFHLAFEETATLNEYRIRTSAGFRRTHSPYLPATPTIVLTAHDGRFPLPSPELLRLHCAVTKILHASGMAEQIDQLLDDNDAIEGKAPNGSTDLTALLSVSKIGMVPSIRHNKQLKMEDLKTSAITEESKENQPGPSSVY
ncbi:hypothetical protein CNMCM5793_002235 [Aspergillus hiratsukae]|uniref:HNH nuclease domain-containing protein n=1 Tax=Aspergillus hiratsukae TaxID=1194566 RepID=A0A8H6UHD8_9EURO|nr:hypothetical protein CNMCM5793_002235 [Aspergillus hiratsukae]KAF7160702.1 hypothetical protein CNMCM6106_008090 [Aspergillus hiratsukae]